ncbi:unnamed protein product [Meganyctiphanes norvegica]|uniref:C2H2-type domain-containing protein n=1 Tax=Meganyctiphanes norvegica TaxID=48144 RepID=A0AAV2PXW2_MEGNR
MKTKDELSTFQLMEVEEVEGGECILLIETENDIVETLFFSPNSSSIGIQTDVVVFSNTSSFPILFCAQPSVGEASTLCNIPYKIDVGTSTMHNDINDIKKSEDKDSFKYISSSIACQSQGTINLETGKGNDISQLNIEQIHNSEDIHRVEDGIEHQPHIGSTTLDTSVTNLVHVKKFKANRNLNSNSVTSKFTTNVDTNFSSNFISTKSGIICKDNEMIVPKRRRGRPPKNNNGNDESGKFEKEMSKQNTMKHILTVVDTPRRRKRKQKHDADFEYEFPGRNEVLIKLESFDEGLIDESSNAEWKEGKNSNIYVGTEDFDEFDATAEQEDLDGKRKSRIFKEIEEDSLLSEIKKELTVMNDNSYLNSEFSNDCVDNSNEFIEENFADTLHQVDMQDMEKITDIKLCSKVKDAQSFDSQPLIKIPGITYNVKSKINDSEKAKKSKMCTTYLNSATVQREKYSKQKIHLEDGKIVYRCPKCNLDFDKRIKLKVHSRSHMKSEQKKAFNCEQCGKFCKDYRKYLAHKAFHDRTYKCQACNRSFALLANLKKHISLHPDAPDKVCDVCGAQFSLSEDLQNHFENQHKKDLLRMYAIKCVHCGKEYMRKQSYEKHINKAPYMCSICNKDWGCEYSLKRHFSLSHSQCVCEFCGKSVKKGALAHHVRLHMEAKVQCPHCPKKFTFRSKMLAHVDANHNNEKKYKCNLCKYTAKTANTVNLHRRLHHTDPSKRRTYQCNICSKEYHLPSKLALHYRSHTGEKPFKCSKCSKAFSSKFNMNDHMKCVHGERVELLQPDGTTSIKVIKHRRAPRGSGRRCDLCGCDFPSSATLVQHIRDRHHAHPVEQQDHNIKQEHISIEVQDESSNSSRIEIVSGSCNNQQQQYGLQEEEEEDEQEEAQNLSNNGVVSIPADAIPEYATHIQINGVEYQVLRQ